MHTYLVPAALARVAAIACIAAGVLMIAGFALHPAGEEPTLGTDPFWVPAHGLLWAAFTLALVGWTGVYLMQASEAGTLGVIAYMMILIGTSFASWIYSTDVTYVPVIASDAPQLFEKIMHGPSLVLGMASVFTWMLGTVLFGISVIRARVFSRWPGILLVIGTASVPILYFAVDSVRIIAAGAYASAAGQIWLGVELKTKTQSSREL